MEANQLLQTVIETQSWEDIIYQIVSLEGLNPWDIDIAKLTDSFVEYIEGLKLLDFRIPAKVVLVAAVLLKLKADKMYPFGEEKEEFKLENGEDMSEYEMMRLKLAQLSLSPPLERFPKRAVTIEELVSALRKAMLVKERKEIRVRTLGRRLRENIDLEEEDIETRIKKLMVEIDGLLTKLKTSKIEFSKIVDEWKRDEIVRHFLPLLYLASRGKVETEQEEFFKEIFISVRKIQDQKSNFSTV